MNYTISRKFFTEHTQGKSFKSLYVGDDENEILNFLNNRLPIRQTYRHYGYYFWNSYFGCYFQYLASIKRILVEDVPDLDINVLKNELVDADNCWEYLDSEDQTPNRFFTLNVFHRLALGSSITYGELKNTNILEVEEPGVYKNRILHNKVTGETIEFATFLEADKYSASFYLAFAEKAFIPFCPKDCTEITAFIYNHLFQFYDKNTKIKPRG